MSPAKTREFVDAYLTSLDDTFARTKLGRISFTDTFTNKDLGIPFASYDWIKVDFAVLDNPGGSLGNPHFTTGTLWYDNVNSLGSVMKTGTSDAVSTGYYGLSSGSSSTFTSRSGTTPSETIVTFTLDKGASNYRLSMSKTGGEGNLGNATCLVKITYGVGVSI